MGGICEKNGKIFITGRNHIEVFNTQTETFTKISTDWKKKLLSLIVNINDSILILRGKILGKLNSDCFCTTITKVDEAEW